GLLDTGPLDTGSFDVASDAGTDIEHDASASDADDAACVLGTSNAVRSETATLQGTFQMGADADAGTDFASAVPRHPATVDPFTLDKLEVTVGKFRQFVNDYTCWRRAHPAPDEGAVGGRGWQPEWTGHLVSEVELRTGLDCDADAGAPRATWSDVPGDAG